MVKAVIFDCFGVLYRSSADELYDRCPSEKRHDLHAVRQQRDYGYLQYDEYLQATAELIGTSPADVQHITETSHVRNDELLAYIQKLNHQTIHVGMLSNIGDTTMQQLFTADEIAALFDAAVLSYEVGVVKPEPEAYRLIAMRLGVDESDCVMIDDLEKNCRGAEAVGMRAIWHQHNQTTIDQLEALRRA